MPYATADLINWGKISQPLARYGEARKKAFTGASIDQDLDIKLFLTRKDVEYEYAQDPTSTILFPIGNYFLTLMGIYFFAAQRYAGGGGVIPPLNPGAVTVNDLDFIVSASSIIATGESSIYFDGTDGNPDFRGMNLNFNRNAVPQYTTNPGTGELYFAWNKAIGFFQLLGTSAEAAEGERFRIMPDNAGGSAAQTVAETTTVTATGANFEPDGVTLNLPFIADADEVMLFVVGYNSEWQFAPAFFTKTVTGIVITASGFDANDYTKIIIQKIN